MASIQKRTSPVKFDDLAEKSENGSTSNLSTKVKSIVELDASCKAGGTDGGDGSALTAEDRESKRAAEIAALEEALCIFGECPNEETPPLEDESKIDPKNELSPSIAAKLGVTGLKEKLGGFLQKP